MFYVYVLCDQGVPFYVGKGTGDRAYIHERLVSENLSRKTYEFGVERDYNPHKTRKIKSILDAGRVVEYQFPFYHEDEDVVLAEERRLIGIYGRSNMGGLLTNIHPGGRGGDTYSGLSDDRKQAIKERRKQYTPSSETREKIRAASMGRTHTDAAKEKIRQAKVGKTTGLSKKRGIPATGGNAKGIRQAWNASVAVDDPRVQNHRAGLQEFHRNNPDHARQTYGLQFRLRSPTGEIVEGRGLTWLVENYDVSTRIRDLIRGRIDSYKGWTRVSDTVANSASNEH